MSYVLPLVLLTSVLGITQLVGANLLEELDASQALQSASAGNQVPSSGSPAPQPATDLNTGEGLKSGPDGPVASSPFQSDGAGRPVVGCSSTGPVLNLAPGSYIQFKVAVPPGFLARMDDTPDGGKVITVISPEPQCPKCGTPGSAVNSFDAPAPTPGVVNVRGNMPGYQEPPQMMQRSVQGGNPGNPQPSYPQQYSAPEQSMSSSQMYVKNNAYRKVQVQAPNPIQYQARSSQNLPPQPSFQRAGPQPLPPPQQPQMSQRMVRPPPQYQPMASSQYQQPQYSQVNNAPEYQQPLQQQQSSPYVQQGGDAFQQQPQFQPQPQQSAQPVAALEKFHKALRSLDDGGDQQ